MLGDLRLTSGVALAVLGLEGCELGEVILQRIIHAFRGERFTSVLRESLQSLPNDDGGAVHAAKRVKMTPAGADQPSWKALTGGQWLDMLQQNLKCCGMRVSRRDEDASVCGHVRSFHSQSVSLSFRCSLFPLSLS